MGNFRATLLWQIGQKLISNNNAHFLRIYISLFAPFFIILLAFSLISGSNFITFMVNMSFLTLACLPVTVLVSFLLSRTSGSLIDCLYGLRITEDNSEAIRNSELNKIIPLKEKGSWDILFRNLSTIEEEYGISSRLVYERALCLIELGEHRKARRCVKEFLSGCEKEEKDRPYFNYCRQLLHNEASPLALEKIIKLEKARVAKN